ncbi:MAG TPA: TRAP transporter small permease [Kiloniellales bacterium]|nr:TRAP transporter small permease [Kiloniellales bacterium]
MRTYIRVVTALSRAAGFFSCLLLLAAVLVVTHMVVVRYLLQGSTVWQTEFVTYAAVAATFLGSGYVLLLKGHVNIDILPNVAGPRLRRVLDVVSVLACLLFCLLLGWSSWHFLYEALANGWKTPTVWKLPLWIPILPLPLGLALLFLQYVAELLRARSEASR